MGFYAFFIVNMCISLIYTIVCCFLSYRYPGTTFMDHIMRYQAEPDVKIIIVLGEVCVISSCSQLESVTLIFESVIEVISE